MSFRIFLLILFFFSCGFLYAQIGDTPGDPGGGGDVDDVPIAGIEVLIGIGSAFGVSRFLKGYKTKK